MGKIICDLCGTSYSDNASQCPICGNARAADAQSFSLMNNQTATDTQYQYIKGGRFSKSNVRKRNSGKISTPVKKSPDKAGPSKKEVNKSKKSNRGLVITILTLLLAIIAVIAYIVVSFFLPQSLPNKEAEVPTSITEQTNATDLKIPCTQIDLGEVQLVFDTIGATAQLTPTVIPSDTTDVLSFASADESIVIVSDDGLITVMNYGTTAITVSCGDISGEYQIQINEPKPELKLSRDSVEFTQAGESLNIYVGEIPVSEIDWRSDDETVATFIDGTVTAIGNGVTVIYADYSGLTVSCAVNCTIKDVEETEPTEAPTEPLVDNGPYRIRNPYGFSDHDATIRVGEEFTLILVDKNGDQVTTGVTWSIEDGDCCTVTDGTVKGVSSGSAKVVATFNGKTYSFTVRVS